MRVVFMGKSKKSSIKALKYLLRMSIEVVCVVCPKSNEYTEETLESIATRNSIPVFSYEEFCKMVLERDVLLSNIDWIFSFLFWKKIGKDVLTLPIRGCINFHPAPLPEYRGLGGYNFAILDRLDYWGVSAHFIDDSIDTGDIIRVDRFKISSDIITAFDLENISQKKLLKLFYKIINDIILGKKLSRIKQGSGRYIDRFEFEAAKRITTNDNTEIIDRKIRAFWFPPYEGAYIEIGGKRYTLVNNDLLQSISKWIRPKK